MAMDRTRILEIVRAEFHKHHFDYYAESVSGSNRKNTVPGCTICKVRLHTVSQFVDHLEAKVEAAFEREFARSDDPARVIPFPVALHKIDPCPRKFQVS